MEKKKKKVLEQTLINIRTHPMIKEASDTSGKVIDYSINGARNLTVLQGWEGERASNHTVKIQSVLKKLNVEK